MMNGCMYVCWVCVVAALGLFGCTVSRCRYWHRLADNRLSLLRTLIDKAYVHRDRPQEFAREFRLEISVRNLRNSGIVSPRRFPSVSDVEEDERFLLGLLDAGFSRREVCAIFDLKSVNCFYVKYHRVKKKLSRVGKTTKRTSA